MAKLAKFLQGVAGAAGGAALNVEDVFSTYLYEGNGSTQTITNGIDLDGEGGLVWTKSRTENVYTGYSHTLFDTERGMDKRISTDTNGAQVSGMTFSATSTGFSDGYNTVSGEDMASWTFRKAPKFFDVVTYTGDGTSGRTVSHNLGSVPGCIIVKRTDTTSDWTVYHRKADPTAPEDKWLKLNSTSAVFDYPFWNDTPPTDTQFELNNNVQVNASGGTYVAYLFAHNDGDGEFGPDGDADIIKCGSYTGANPATVDLGFEPQWIMIKRASGTGDWVMFDAMRGLVVEGNDAYVYANTSGAEVSNTRLNITSTGFSTDTTDYRISSNGETYIYIAIRRGPMAVPESATDVFAIDTEGSSEPYYDSSFPVDFGLQKRHNASGDWFAMSRLTQGKTLKANLTNAEVAETSAYFDYMNGFVSAAAYGSGNSYGWMWRRAPSFFDVVTGPWADGTSIKHNLGVTPELLIKKTRTGVNNWYVWTTGFGSAYYLNLDSTSEKQNNLGNLWGTIDDTQIVNLNYGITTESIFFLFASLDGVSKVGSYTGNGTSQTIDCGFSSGARFVLIKRVDSGGQWYLFDSVRGIVSGNDSFLKLNSSAAEVTSYDIIDPVSSGFIVNQDGNNQNASGGEYIFYAIA